MGVEGVPKGVAADAFDDSSFADGFHLLIIKPISLVLISLQLLIPHRQSLLSLRSSK
jgi:hypothetical protein